MVNSFRVARVFTLFSHFLITSGLIWTSVDNIHAAMKNPGDDSLYWTYINQYHTMLVFIND